jgi:[ribosomal protein S5]-alanine N-acetyltransferase
MREMLYQENLEVTPVAGQAVSIVGSDWRSGLPLLTGLLATLRELVVSDAPSVFSMLATEEIARFIAPPPTSIEGFERFIAWSHRQRAAGQHACFAIVARGFDAVVGLVQVRPLGPGFATAEWAFALSSMFRGTGVFADAAEQVLDFVFTAMGVHRLEARAAVRNGRGNGALRKMGAVQEGVLRRSLFCNGEYLDQLLWSILAEDWLQTKLARRPRVIH